MTEPGALPHELKRVLVIQASRETVFRFFTDEARWAAWWGAGSTIDARPGGRVVIRYPNAVEAWGEVLEVAAPERITFTYGYASGTPIPAGGSRVTIRLDAEGARTRLHLTHQFADAAVRDEHVQGWRYQLSLFANAVANEVYAQADRSVDAWFEAWSESDSATRDGTLSRIANRDVGFRDSVQRSRGAGRSVRPPGGGPAFHAGHPPAPNRRRPALPGRCPGRLGGARQRRGGTVSRHERVRVQLHGPDRIGHGFLESAPSAMKGRLVLIRRGHSTGDMCA
jgi:uncharacterized protein YndB with AHSA1/START domain